MWHKPVPYDNTRHGAVSKDAIVELLGAINISVPADVKSTA